MKKIFTLFTALLSFAFSFSQSTYYFRGNGNATQTIGNTFFTASNWREEVAGVISNTAPASLTPGSFLKVVGLQLTITSATTTTTNFVVMISGGRRPGSTTNLNGNLILDDVLLNFNSCSPVSQMILRSNNVGGTLYHGVVTLINDADIIFRSLRNAPFWAANSFIANGSYVVNAGRLYQATATINNSGTTPPTHTAGNIILNLRDRGLYDCSNSNAYTPVTKARGTGSPFGTQYSFSSAGGTLAASTGTSNFTNTLGTSTGFVLNGQAVLPLQLGGFSAQKGTGKVSLNWSTVLEVNTSHFEVEQSNNGSTWKTISIVAAKGNSNSAQKYTADDIANYSSKVYYRLKMVDIDGKFEYSPIAVVTFGGKGKLFAYPNPAASFTMVSSDKAITENVTVSIFNTTGVLVKQQVITNPGNNFRVGLEDLKQGTYLLKINQGAELLEVIKIQKN